MLQVRDYYLLLESKINNIFIVAGAGGGGYYHDNSYYRAWGPGGHGGGIVGNDGKTYGDYTPGKGGTQTSVQLNGVSDSFPPSFGKGGSGAFCTTTPINTHFNGGGAGLFGGSTSAYAGAGGGSSYIGNSLLTNKVMYCYDCTTSDDVSTKTISVLCSNSLPEEKCAKKGNGYAKITLVALNKKNDN